MHTDYSSKFKVVGFGRTPEEAKEELAFNIARQNLDNDPTGIYKKRREQLYSWLPLPNILSIREVLAISYENGFLRNNKTGEQLYIRPTKLAHYLFLFNLMGNDISFSDFTLVIGKEIDNFLANISPIFGKLDDFPYCKPGDMMDAINVTNYSHGCFSCDTKQGSEVLVCDGTKVLSIEIPEDVDKACIIAYGFAKMGIMFDGTEVHLCRTGR